MSSVTVCNYQHNTPDPEGLQAVSARQSGQQKKTPDGHTAELVAWYGQLVTAGRTQTLVENVNQHPQQYQEPCCSYATIAITMTGLKPVVKVRATVAKPLPWSNWSSCYESDHTPFQCWAYPVVLHVL